MLLIRLTGVRSKALVVYCNNFFNDANCCCKYLSQKNAFICAMRKTILFLLISFPAMNVHAQVKKIDTTATIGTTGYRVSCPNKSESENQVSVSPKGFDKEVRDLSFMIKGRLRKILVEDINADGYADVILCVYGGANGEMGNVAVITSSGKNSLVPAYFPDIYSNPKLSAGYKGHDEFTVMVGTLMQSFPIYLPADTDTPTGGTRVIQYQIEKGENGGLKFKVLRSYEKK